MRAVETQGVLKEYLWSTLWARLCFLACAAMLAARSLLAIGMRLALLGVVPGCLAAAGVGRGDVGSLTRADRVFARPAARKVDKSWAQKIPRSVEFTKFDEELTIVAAGVGDPCYLAIGEVRHEVR